MDSSLYSGVDLQYNKDIEKELKFFFFNGQRREGGRGQKFCRGPPIERNCLSVSL